MKIIDPGTGWFEIYEGPTFDLNEVTGSNDEYIGKSSARVSYFSIIYVWPDNHIHTDYCLTMYLILNKTSLLC